VVASVTTSSKLVVASETSLMLKSVAENFGLALKKVKF